MSAPEKNRLRVAIFSDSALPILNGVSVSIDALVTELRNQGHSVHIYTARVPGYKDSDPNTYRFRSIEWPGTSGYPVSVPPYWRMLLRFRRHEYDIVHTHTPWILGMVGLRWAESQELPIVSTYHTLYDRYAHYINWLPRRYVRFRVAKHTNFYYNRVDHVLTPTDAAFKWLRRHSVSTPVTVVPTASPRGPVLDRSETRQRLGMAPEQKVLLYVGRLAREKNVQTLVEAAAIAFSEDPSLRLWLVGEGPFRDDLRSLVRALGIGDRVRFVGAVPRAEVDAFYAAADLFVFSSVTETQGLVVQEAMMYGLPAVAVVGGGASAAVADGSNGYVVKNDPSDFAGSVLKILGDDALYARFADNAARSVRQRGTAEMCDEVVNVYRSVIRERKNGATVKHFAWI